MAAIAEEQHERQTVIEMDVDFLLQAAASIDPTDVTLRQYYQLRLNSLVLPDIRIAQKGVHCPKCGSSLQLVVSKKGPKVLRSHHHKIAKEVCKCCGFLLEKHKLGPITDKTDAEKQRVGMSLLSKIQPTISKTCMAKQSVSKRKFKGPEQYSLNKAKSTLPIVTPNNTPSTSRPKKKSRSELLSFLQTL